MGKLALGLAVATASGALAGGINFGSYEKFKNDDFGGGFTNGAKAGALVAFVFGAVTLGIAFFTGASLPNMLSGLGSPLYMNGVGSLQNSLGSPMYMNGLGALVASPVGALVASPVGSCVGCGDWF